MTTQVFVGIWQASGEVRPRLQPTDTLICDAVMSLRRVAVMAVVLAGGGGADDGRSGSKCIDVTARK